MNLYSTTVTTIGGRTGHSASSDGRLAVDLSIPKGIGGDDGPGTNPEQLFAAGYSACFDSALRLVARREKIDVGADARMQAEVGLARTEAGGFGLNVVMTGHFPSLPRDVAERLMAAAHQVCPYSNATRGNIPVDLKVTGADGATFAVAAHAG
jgi:osmotically inducible protein OsmC